LAAAVLSFLTWDRHEFAPFQATRMKRPPEPEHNDLTASLTAMRPQIARRLRGWFRRHARPLPWRRTRDAYAIWVSEVMLQQTQVATVLPYFKRFLETLPTVTALASASDQEVLRLWEGLGYYRRARDLHRAARIIHADHDGRIPRDPAVLRTLPGFGRYTVGAVLSQAFDQRLPILEANSLRVLCRLLGYRDDPRRGVGQRVLWHAAHTLLPRRQVGDFNQALMELGALVCTPQAPRCGACPLAQHCQAHERGLQEDIPRRPPDPVIEHVAEVAVVVRKGPRVLLVQRPGQGRWAGMWEFPHRSLQDAEDHDAAARRLLADLGGIEASLANTLAIIRHGVTRFRITMVCKEAEYRAGRFRSRFYQAFRWVRPSALREYPVSAPQRRLAALLLGQRQARLF
jgi:A/G-specific adenine glycosylase